MTQEKRNQNYFWIALFLVLLLICIIRYPNAPNEIGWDSFRTHDLSNIILNEGYVKWSVNPLSIFGLYPYSYASAVPILLAEITAVTHISMTKIILLFSIFTGILGFFSAYLMAGVFKNNRFFQLTVGFSFSFFLLFVNLTTWTVSTRALYIALVPFFLYLLLKLIHTKKIKFLILLSLLFIILALIHHMYILVVMFIAAIIITSIYFFWIKNIAFFQRYEKYMPWIFIPIFFLLFFLPFIIKFTFASYFNDFRLNNEFIKNLYFVVIRYARDIGILGILVLIGFISILFKKEKRYLDYYIIFCMLLITPFLSATTYTPTFIMPLAALLSGYGMFWLIDHHVIKKYAPILLGVVILLSIITALIFQIWAPSIYDKNNEGEKYLTPQEETLGQWINNNTDANFLVSNQILGDRLSSVAYCRIVGSDERVLSCSNFSKEDIIIQPLSVFSPTFWADYPYKVKNQFRYQASYVTKYLTYNDRYAINFNSKYNVDYYIVNRIDARTTALEKSLKPESELFFNNGEQFIWLIR